MSIHRLPTESPSARDFARVLLSDRDSHVGMVLERIELEPETRLLLEFGRAEAPLFAIGETHTLSFTGAVGEHGEQRARVLFRAEDERVRRYEFRLLDAPAVFDQDRRRHERHPAHTEVEATLVASGGLEAPAFIRDISMHGMALHADLAVDRELVEHDEVEILIDIVDQAPIHIAARLVYRRLFDGRIHYGVEFAEDATSGIEDIARLDRHMGGEGLRQAS